MSIKLLNSLIVNQIAAGEVIENPSAIVKELVENSIDAGANNIEIEIKKSGIELIQIKDNGKGMSKSDILKAPLRHATSKIKTFDDLYNIKTMGFRGEALASIFSVAKTKIISKQKNSNISYEIDYTNLNEVKETSSDFGTLVIVEDLFYNTPVRKKYLKSENQEFKLILDVLNRFLLVYNEIRFNIKHNGKLILNKPKFNSKKDNLYYILGNNLRDNLLDLNQEIDGLKINGFISKPSNLTYPVRKNQYLFVNNRFVKSKLIRDAIYEGFGTNLMEGRHPLFVINLKIDPEIIDVNINPSKIEIKFENELEVYNFIRRAIKKVFEKEETFKPFESKYDTKKESQISLDKKINLDISINNNNNSPLEKEVKNLGHKSYFSTELQKPLELKEDEIKLNSHYNENKINYIENETQKNVKNLKFNNGEKISYGPLYDRLKEYRVVGQINKTFIILETPSEMIMIDQHVAEEKFYFEKFKEELENKKITSQTLLKSEIINLANSEMMLYKDNLDLLEKIGFEVEEFSANSIIVRAVPIGIRGQLIDAKVISDILHEINIDKKFKLLEDKKIEKLASMSCKKSIKAGHELTKDEIIKMIEQLKKLKEPFNCPHGRPILLNWSFLDLEKKFKRIV